MDIYIYIYIICLYIYIYTLVFVRACSHQQGTAKTKPKRWVDLGKKNILFSLSVSLFFFATSHLVPAHFYPSLSKAPTNLGQVSCAEPRQASSADGSYRARAFCLTSALAHVLRPGHHLEVGHSAIPLACHKGHVGGQRSGGGWDPGGLVLKVVWGGRRERKGPGSARRRSPGQAPKAAGKRTDG